MSRYFKNTSKFTGTIREPQVLTKIQKSKNLPELQPTMFRLGKPINKGANQLTDQLLRLQLLKVL